MESAAIGGCASLGGGSILGKCQNFGTSRIVFALCVFFGLRVDVVFWNCAFWICTCDANPRAHTYMICLKTYIYIFFFLQGPFARHDSLPCHYSYENLQG